MRFDSLAIDVFMAPHHGSDKSNIPELAKWAKPKLVVSCQTAPISERMSVKMYEQMGAKYFVTGHISGNDERSEDMRRIQYFLYLEVVDVETSEKLFLAKSEITKAVR